MIPSQPGGPGLADAVAGLGGGEIANLRGNLEAPSGILPLSPGSCAGIPALVEAAPGLWLRVFARLRALNAGDPP
jgi:hypothetical protein